MPRPHLEGGEVASQLLHDGLQCTGLGSGVAHEAQVEEQSIPAVLLVLDAHGAADQLLLHGRPVGRHLWPAPMPSGRLESPTRIVPDRLWRWGLLYIAGKMMPKPYMLRVQITV